MFEGEATREKLRKLQAQAPLTIHLRQEIDRWAGGREECCGLLSYGGAGRPGGGLAGCGRQGGRKTHQPLLATRLAIPLSAHDQLPLFFPLPPRRLNRVVSLVGATLRDLRLAIAGTIALSDELAEALDALFNARVPKRWAKIRCGAGRGLAGSVV